MKNCCGVICVLLLLSGQAWSAVAQDIVKEESTMAERLVREGDELSAQRNAAAQQQAVTKYEAALALWRKLGDRANEAEILNKLGVVAAGRGDARKGLDYIRQSLTIYQALGDRRGQSRALHNSAADYHALGEMRLALENYEQALAMRRADKDRENVAATLNGLGNLYNQMGDLQKNAECLAEALGIYRELKDRTGEGRTLNNLGITYYRLNELQKSLDMLNQALPIRRAVGDRRGEMLTLLNFGNVYDKLSEWPTAIGYFDQTLAISREIGDKQGQAMSLNNIGLAERNLGDWARAADHFNQAYQLARELGNRLGEALTLKNLGRTYAEAKDQTKALNYYQQALLLSRQLEDRRGEAGVMADMADVYLENNDAQQALPLLTQALTINREISERRAEILVLSQLSRLRLSQNQLPEARANIEAAVAIAETMRSQIISPNLRSSYFSEVRDFYHLYVDVLMRQHGQQPTAGHDALALQTSERARARSLVELLTETGAEIRRGVAPELLQRERDLQKSLTEKSERLILLRKTETAQSQKLRDEVAKLTVELEEVEGRIRAVNPGYSALTRPQPLTLREIQQQVLDRDSLLLEYSLGVERSYLFAVTPTGLTTYVLPSREKIEAAARRVTQLLNTRPASGVAPSAEYQKAASELSAMILQPVADQLRGQRLLIVADGALNYVPFAALSDCGMRNAECGAKTKKLAVNPQSAIRNPQSFTPLIVNHEIVNLPSATTLAVLRREVKGRQAAPKAVAVLADPVFSADDERLTVARQGKAAAKEAAVAMATETARVLRGGFDTVQLPRLQMSRAEAETIGKLTPPETRFKALDFQANREVAMSADLSQYRIVHFATHGVFNSQQPELSGLIFSLVDEHGAAQNGLLRVGEIYNLKLPAELVVLSACRTGLGKEIKGEGVVGLTRGFMYAGSKRVVASLWNVSDAATGALMQRFYEGMLGPKKLSPAAALRAAQVAMWREARWQSPFYWAAFVLQGEW